MKSAGVAPEPAGPGRSRGAPSGLPSGQLDLFADDARPSAEPEGFRAARVRPRRKAVLLWPAMVMCTDGVERETVLSAGVVTPAELPHGAKS